MGLDSVSSAEKMIIRPMYSTDLEWVRMERNRPECRKWFRQPNYLTVEQQQKWFKETDMLSFVIDGWAGVVSLSHIDNIARKCEFSIMIAPAIRGKGFGKRALWELLRHAFNDLNMMQVYSDVFSHSPALKWYDDFGFKRYGILPQWYYKDGKYIDSTIIRITKDEFNNLLEPSIPKL